MVDIDTRATAFGRVLGTIMEARGIPAEPAEIRALGERSGLGSEKLLAATTRDTAEEMGGAEARGLLGGLAGELGLSKRETLALAAAFVFEDDDAEEEERAGG